MTPADSVKKVLILGVGNILLRDEGLGVRVVEKIISEHLLPDDDDVEALDGGTLGLTLLPYMECREAVFIVDAIDSGARPGNIFRLTKSSDHPNPPGTEFDKLLYMIVLDATHDGEGQRTSFGKGRNCLRTNELLQPFLGTRRVKGPHIKIGDEIRILINLFTQDLSVRNTIA